MKTFALLSGLVWSWCGTSPPDVVAPAPTPPPCTPLSGPDTEDVAVIVACDGCRQRYFSGMGLGDVTFDECVVARTARVRAKLAADPHRYDDVVHRKRS
jgi:hypothetical protein